MRQAGHSEQFRRRVTIAAIGRHKKIMDEESQGLRKFYRDKFEIIQSRIKSRRKKITSGWFRDRGYNAVLRVQNTPGGKLAKMI